MSVLAELELAYRGLSDEEGEETAGDDLGENEAGDDEEEGYGGDDADLSSDEEV